MTTEAVIKKGNSKIIILIAVGILIVAGLGYFGVKYYIDNAKYVSSDSARVIAETYPVTSKTGGEISEVDVNLGEKVKKADTLIKFFQSAIDVKAPEDGTVVMINTYKGSTATPGMPMAYLANMSKLRVEAYILESDVKKIKSGQQVKITVDAFPGDTYSGKVKEIGLATASQFSLFDSNNSSGNFTKVSQRIPVIIDLENNKDNRMILGLSATVKINVE